MKKRLVLLALLGVFVFAVACGSVYEKEPVGIGPDYSELKKSPCACMPLKTTSTLPEWLS